MGEDRMKVKFRCVDCHQKYSFDADPGEEIRFRCRQCGAVQTFVVPEEQEVPAAIPVPPPQAEPALTLKPVATPVPPPQAEPALTLKPAGAESAPKPQGNGNSIPSLRLPPRLKAVGNPPPAEAEPAANRILNSGRREIRGAYGCNTSVTGRTGIGRSGFVWKFRLFYS